MSVSRETINAPSPGDLSTGGTLPHQRAPLAWGLVGYGLAAVACGLIFRQTLVQLPGVWNVDPNYSHGFLVPIAFVLFAARQWKLHGPPVSGSATAADVVAGTIRIAAGLSVHLVGFLFDVMFFDVVGLVLVLGGVTVLIAGKRRYRHYAFPLWFLVFMAPLPGTWYQTLAIAMQQVASAVSAFIFSVFDVPAYREGCTITVPGYRMEVGAACSGLRQLAAIVALSLAVGHLSRRTAAFKWALGLLSIPIAIAANCIRVTLTGFILMSFGREWAEGVYHTLEGLAIVAVAAVLILLTAWWLSRFSFSKVRQKEADSGQRTAERPLTAHHSFRVVLIGVLLGAGVVAQLMLGRHLAAVENIPATPLQKPLSDFPRQLGGWSGRDVPIDEQAAEVGDERLQRDYPLQESDRMARLWMVYSTVGADRSHHPEVCMAVAGQPEDRSARRAFRVGGEGEEPIMQYRFGRTGRQQWVFYWYYTLPAEKPEQLAGLQKLYRQTHFRPSSVTVEVFVPSRSPDDDREPREFVRMVDRTIRRHLGPGAVRESRRIPVTVIHEARPPHLPE